MIQHPELGRLARSRGAWRGHVSIAEGLAIRLSVMGKRSGPDPEGLTVACTIPGGVDGWRPSIEAALRDHAEDAGVIVDELPQPSFAAVIAVDGSPTIEFGFHVPWDDDHTIGICVRDGIVVELNGSVLEP